MIPSSRYGKVLWGTHEGIAWWGEGEVKLYLDGDREHATLVGTGAEDYPGTAWGMGL